MDTTSSAFGPTDQDVLARLWLELATGRARVSRVYSDASQHCAELVTGRDPPRLSDLELLVPVLLGRQQKDVAAEVGCSISNVATVAARGLHAMGVECRTKDTPMIIVMMVHAFHRPRTLRRVRVRCEHAPLGITLVSTSRPEAEIEARLSLGEREVLRRRVEGLTYEDIARARHTSVRTVANQVASASGKLGISGRLALLASLIGEGRGALLSRNGHEVEPDDSFSLGVPLGPPRRSPDAHPTAE